MCMYVMDSEPIEITKPIVAWKVFRADGRFLHFPYLLAPSFNSKVNSRLFKPKKLYKAHPWILVTLRKGVYHTSSGFHVFVSPEEAQEWWERYGLGDSRLVPVLVWGKAYCFQAYGYDHIPGSGLGYAVEFMTGAEV